MKIDFTKFPCYVDIRKAAKKEMDVRYELSNAMYTYGNGIVMGALAMKIYNAGGEADYSEQEIEAIRSFAKGLSPLFSDSFNDYLTDKNK